MMILMRWKRAFIPQQKNMKLQEEVAIFWRILIKLARNEINSSKTVFIVAVVLLSWDHFIMKFLKFNRAGIVLDFKQC